jgi:hypothetical protein
MAQRRRIQQLSIDWTKPPIGSLPATGTELPVDDTIIEGLTGVLGDAIDEVFDDFRNRLRREGRTMTIGTYRALVEETVYRASGRTVSMFDDDEYIDWLGCNRS